LGMLSGSVPDGIPFKLLVPARGDWRQDLNFGASASDGIWGNISSAGQRFSMTDVKKTNKIRVSTLQNYLYFVEYSENRLFHLLAKGLREQIPERRVILL